MASATAQTYRPPVRSRLRFGRPHDSQSGTALLLLAPVVAYFVLFQYYPILKSVVISFMKYGLLLRERPFVGLANYARLLDDPLFLSALGNTLLFVFVVVVVGVVLALFFAVLVERTGRLAPFYRTLYFIPVVTSLLATSMIWRWLFAPTGLINYMFVTVGLHPQSSE